ncbi:MAG TPA: DUF4129 domain-containing protein [Anaerolineae bacterium]|nr:DUF4129 domain-containing protein [Anaerolineae bacterium]HOR01371.1 DUF4129 domain-containing protein [Anaerolineae bacterium]HPL30410.1 DUF4129 domain-containing protein [Anaerolineae bacterium]
MSLRRIAWRRELVVACLLGMEAVWLTAWTALLLGTAYVPERRVPAMAVLALLVVAYCSARGLAASRLPLGVQQVCCGLLAIVSGLVLAGLYLYPRYPFAELDWLLAWAADLGSEGGPSSAVLMGLSLYAWWRGISLNMSRLGSEQVGLYLRVGVVALLSFYLLGLFLEADQQAGWVLLYFGLGLVAEGLARVEEVRQWRGAVRSPFGRSWLAIMGGSALAVIALASLGAFALSHVSGMLFWLVLAPLVGLLGRVLWVLLQAMGYLLVPLMQWLLGWLQGALPAMEEIMGNVATPAPAPTPAAAEAPSGFPVPVQAIVWVLVGLGFLAIVAFLMTALQRRRPATAPDAPLDATWEAAPAGHGPGLGAALGRLRDRLTGAFGSLRPGSYATATVHEIYASLQRLAAWKGIARAEAQTPYEYEQQLGGAWPGAEGQIDAITHAYVRAHYGQRAVTPQELEALRAAWHELRESIENQHRHQG